MAEVFVKDEFAAAVDEVWDLIGDFAGVARWAAIERCEVEGEGVGAVRTLTLPGGISLKERLDAFDPEGHGFRYSMTDPGPLPLANYRASVRLAEAGPRRCSIEWRGTFDPKGPEEPARRMVEGIYTGGIKAIKKLLGA
jgi:hypothetical protein